MRDEVHLSISQVFINPRSSGCKIEAKSESKHHSHNIKYSNQFYIPVFDELKLSRPGFKMSALSRNDLLDGA